MKTFLISSLSKTIHTFLNLDPESRNRLKKLQGKIITLELLPFHFTFQLTFNETGINLQENEQLEADIKITGTPLQLFGVAINKEGRNQFFAEDIKMEGDAELGQRIIELFDALHIDWEEFLSKLIGDVPAYQAGQFTRKISGWLSKTRQSFKDNINEYVHEEMLWFPTREALNDFYSEIDEVKMTCDRIEQRIKNLKDAL